MKWDMSSSLFRPMQRLEHLIWVTDHQMPFDLQQTADAGTILTPDLSFLFDLDQEGPTLLETRICRPAGRITAILESLRNRLCCRGGGLAVKERRVVPACRSASGCQCHAAAGARRARCAHAVPAQGGISAPQGVSSEQPGGRAWREWALPRRAVERGRAGRSGGLVMAGGPGVDHCRPQGRSRLWK